MNDIPKEIGLKVIDDWRRASQSISNSRPDEAAGLLHFHRVLWNDFDEIFESDRHRIVEMLSEIADECYSFYKDDDWICVLVV